MINRHMIIVVRCVALVLPLMLAASLARAQTPVDVPAPTPVVIAAETLQARQYELLTLHADVDAALYTNPFDANDIEVLAVFDAPSGRQLVLPGFWLQPYQDTCTAPCLQERLQPDGAPEWQVRLAPDEAGTWAYSLQVRDNGTLVSTTNGQIDVSPADGGGFVRVGPNQRYFELADGSPYVPIGHNLHWSWQGSGGWHAYDRWFESLAAAGGNYARLIIDVPWFVGLEWEVTGNYSAAQDAAYRLDRVLELAARHGIRLQLVLLWSQALRDYSGPPVLVPQEPARPDTSADWDFNPYNSANGGFLTTPSQFFSNEMATNLFRRRLRYIAARWGYSPHIFAWELTDELDMIAASDDVTIPWVQNMVTYLRQIDQGRHLITVGSRGPSNRLAQVALLDFTQARVYQSLPIEATSEQTPAVISALRRTLRLNPVPSLLTGFSLNPWYEPTDSDPAGVHFQNTLWAALMTGAGGGGASDWGPTYVVPRQLQRYYAPLAAFASGVDWPRLALQPAEAALFGADPDAYGPVRLSGFERVFRTPPATAVMRTIAADGVYPDIVGVTGYLYGRTYNAEFARPQVYRVTVPVDTYLEVGVRLVSDQAPARLSVKVDDQTPVELALARSSRGVSLRVPLTVGEHIITLDNSGEDWLELDYIQVDQLAGPARVLTLRDDQQGVALAWVQHRGYTWDAVNEAREPLALTFRLDRMPPGRYLTELWEPLTGAVLGEEIVRVGADGVLRFELLPFTSQLALRAFRQPDALMPTATATATATRLPTTTPTPTLTPLPVEATAEMTVEATPPPTRAVTPQSSATPAAVDLQALLDQLPEPTDETALATETPGQPAPYATGADS